MVKRFYYVIYIVLDFYISKLDDNSMFLKVEMGAMVPSKDGRIQKWRTNLGTNITLTTIPNVIIL